MAATVVQFAQYGLEYAEDDYLGELADLLDSQVENFQGSDQFWAEIKS